MLLDDDRVIVAPSDITAAVSCEFGWLRQLDEQLGRVESIVEPVDPMLERTAKLGDEHERQVLEQFRQKYGPHDPEHATGVFDVGRAAPGMAAAQRAAARTAWALRTGADVIYQAAFCRGGFVGYADFLVRDGDAGWAVYDTKLARRAKVPALLQIAAYADELAALGFPVSPTAHLLLGDGTTSSHRVADIVPVYRERRARLHAITAEHRAEPGPVEWLDRRYPACGRCSTCEREVTEHRDLLMVANLTRHQRAALLDAGITTIDELAANDDAVPGISARTLAATTAQARLQVRQYPPHEPSDGQVHHEVFAPWALRALPDPDPGDIFFDFEGDPLWTDDDPSRSGLEYLFGVLEAPVGPDEEPVFRPFWAHDRAQERQALIDFLAYLAERQQRYPRMHVYHYAAYERTALLRLAGRYGVGEDQVDELLRAGVLIDLYAVVRNAIRISQPSYSLKKLEPLYMGDELRGGDVTTATDSIVAYAKYCDLRAAGRAKGAAAALEEIRDYNRYDCLSTMRLRDWLLARAADCGVLLEAAPPPEPSASPGGLIEADEALTAALTDDFADLPRTERTADQQARALLAASLGYHQREAKPFWWAHFDRLAHPVDEWADTSDVLLVDDAEVAQDWACTGRQKKPHRTLRVRGEVAGGTEISHELFALYDAADLPVGVEAAPGHRGTTNVTVTDRNPDDAGQVTIDEIGATAENGGPALPMALAPRPTIRTDGLAAAITEVAAAVAGGALLDSAVLDLLRRRPPRLVDGGPLPDVAPDAAHLAGIVTALDDSYLAVQGPPGSGKTHTGAEVVTALVDLGWTVGVVAQSHRVIENFLTAVADAGVAPDRIGKKGAEAPELWTALADPRIPEWLAGDGGRVLGGTAWDFTNTKRVPRGALDLLVVDEAGQFSLANTVAVSVAARRLLLLGDPQQLPQVSQGTHPEPCDESALSWVMDSHRVMPADRGYFLANSWRLHPQLCAAVSRLSYDDRLRARPEAAGRDLADVPPGFERILVDHHGNATSSVPEAEAIVVRARELIGRPWRETRDAAPRPLAEADILVVAPYNAQVATIRRAMLGAGLDGVRVGTVDKFQGQQAPVVFVSLAASDPAEVPRGMGFLLNRNRINVAISRAQWSAIVVRSPRLTDYLPSDPPSLAELGAFIALAESA
jgi:uncharacterized protein